MADPFGIILAGFRSVLEIAPLRIAEAQYLAGRTPVQLAQAGNVERLYRLQRLTAREHELQAEADAHAAAAQAPVQHVAPQAEPVPAAPEAPPAGQAQAAAPLGPAPPADHDDADLNARLNARLNAIIGAPIQPAQAPPPALRPPPPNQPHVVATGSVSATSTATLLANTKAKDLLEKQGPKEPLMSFEARLRGAINGLEPLPPQVLTQLVHSKLNEECKGPFASYIGAIAPTLPTSLTEIFAALRQRMPSAAKESEPGQQSAEAAAVYADRCVLYVRRACPDARDPEALAAVQFLHGLRDGSLKKHVLLKDTEYRVANGRSTPLSLLIEWATTYEQAEVRATPAATEPAGKIRCVQAESSGPADRNNNRNRTRSQWLSQNRTQPQQPQHSVQFRDNQPPRPASSAASAAPRPPPQQGLAPGQSQQQPQAQQQNEQNAPPSRPSTASGFRRSRNWPEKIKDLPYYQQMGVCWRCGSDDHPFRDVRCPQLPDYCRTFL